MARSKGAAAEIQKLRKEIREHDRRYYLEAAPVVSDAEYDALMQRLRELEAKHPELVAPDSPTQRVGGGPSSDFKPVRHALPMLSIDNTYDAEETQAWDARVRRLLNGEPEYVVEAKIDGLSCALTYADGALAVAATRGDGEVGEEVTPNVRTLRSVPLALAGEVPKKLDVRGEVFLSREEFERINQQQKEAGREPFVNPRNCAAGSLRQKDSRITASRKLRFLAHSFAVWEGAGRPESHSEFLARCGELGLPANPVLLKTRDIKEVIGFHAAFREEGLPKLPYDIDGLVVKVDAFAAQRRLGSTNKSPRWAIAFKYPAQQASATVEDVLFSVGRTGTITPVARLIPVFCGGVTITNVTLHNFAEVERLGIHAGDKILVQRAGEVIPQVVKVVGHPGPCKTVKPPSSCPVCGGKVVKEEEFVAYYCDNPDCPAQLKRTLLHFSSRAAMDIQGFGEAVVDQLVDSGKVRSIADIYSIKTEDLLKLELFAEKRAENLVAQIDASRSRPLTKLVYGLGIRHVGERTASQLAEVFSLDELAKASAEELQRVPEIGPVVAASIAEFFSTSEVRKLLERLKKAGLDFKLVKRAKADTELSGRSFVFTGELETMTREQAEEKVKALGAKASSSVSGKTSFVVAGPNAGSKLEKAKTLGVPVLDEKQFLELVGRAAGG